MFKTIVFNATNKPSELERNNIAKFLHTHLEQYGDPKEDILSCITYVLKERVSFGGFIVCVLDEDKLIGAVIVNKTGMSGYIPENILVYIAIHKKYRGKGLGKTLMEKTLKLSQGDIALHVEKDNPARYLYEKYGFTTPYHEMRYSANQ